MDFAVNEAFLTEVKSRLDSDAEEINGLVNSIYGKIAGLNSSWGGDSYNEFASSCEEYKTSMQQLSTILKAFAVLIDDVQKPRTELESAITKALNM